MPKPEYKSYLLTVLTIIFAFNLLDRMALGLVFEDIKADLQLSDTQLGFLSGIAFALFYAAMGIPIARWADRGNRVTIISLAAACWSVLVALCGAAGNFVQLLLIRVGVAVGEAGCTPPALSLITDYFTRGERPRAAAIYGLGGPIACVVGYFLAGWLNELYGWRVMFVMLGAPGVVLAVLAWLTLEEPRSMSEVKPAEALAQPSMKDTWVALWGIATFRNVLLCSSVMSFFMHGIFQWQPAFMMRTYGLSSGQVGSWFAASYGVGGLLGSYLGGAWASRYAGQDERLQLKALTVAMILAGILSFCVYLAPTHQIAFALMSLYLLAALTINGPVYGLIQTLVPESMRATAFALMFLFQNLVGMGLGPLVTGVLSDAFQPLVGESSLRYALMALTPGFIWVAWYAWRASKTVERDLAAQRACERSGDEADASHGLASSYVR